MIGKSSIQVQLVIDRRFRFSCPTCHARFLTHSYRDIYVRDLPLASHQVQLVFELMQGVCPSCGKYHTCRPCQLHPSMGCTWRLMRLISEMFRFVPAWMLAKLFHISASSIRRIDHEVLATTLPPVNLDDLKAILIDEKYLGKANGFVSLVLNAHTGEPVYMAPGKSVESLDGFFSMLTQEQRHAIQVVGIDRSNAYKAAVEKYLPHAAICFDHFHVISNLNDALDQVRREELSKASEMDRRLISNTRYLLLRGSENMSESGTKRLDQLLLSNRKIADGYVLKEQFRDIYKARDVNGGIWRLSDWLRMVRVSSIEPLKRFAKGLLKNFNEVINFFKYRISSGKIEAANAAISRIQSKTCGLFNIPYLFLKLRQSFYQRI